MAPSESEILQNYLTTPAELPSIITLEDFTELFPKAQRTNPQIRRLYRELQRQRRVAVDIVAQNIEFEEQQGKRTRRVIANARRKAAREDVDQELEIERAVYGPFETDPKHTLSSIIPEMDSAVADLEAEIRELEAQEAALLDSVKQTVGTMSDLRYGRISNATLRDSVIEGLKTVQDACEGKS
ncbi:Cnl2/NKP2 family protein [Colletotrichum karsti]|uniref:Cnl2/NKP2 family protein n=1 Tax=Colletotrichum karsti TaxID=1095194 RepID=A0A9P6I2B1_9PEZI|nr:Cnl2/NKP2 family protein [Colletotrichum karsti]KAF9874505.1 Cnl2/NKP2 family protein [Colletotrichum karsti]